ncbi:VOC family protein [Microtetraspora niveoalba]|uniref:VOC family protein n=1 Tax=Microtetraspora niveoalba TaxID=46175 RepID=UPI000B2A94A0|nr:VOC family protein [Microtetraspora niveoalba]
MSLGAIVEAVVACRDVEASVDFHARVFGFDLIERNGAEALVGVRGVGTGRLRLVPAPSGDDAADPRVWDVGPRLLGLYSRDLARSVRAIDAAGGRSREPVTYPYGSASLSEAVALGRDGVWWTLPQAGPGHRPSPALEGDGERLHGELHTAVIVPADHDAALRFFAEAGGLTVAFDGEMKGEPFERMIGMPAGASLRLSFLVSADQAPARLEIMSFTGVDARDLSDRPLGLRRLVFAAADPDALAATLEAAGGVRLAEHAVRGPGGVEVELRRAGGAAS